MNEVLSPYIIAIVVGWTVSQLIKSIIGLFRHKYMGLRSILFVSGGMPSSHSATLMAVWTVILFKDGLGSGLFGLASVVALIVLYDAVKVRRSSGEQGVALLALMKEKKSIVPYPRVAMGHTPLEVLVGSFLGILIGLSVCLITL
ncbi:MAG: putative integral rane protein [Candidatus Saccharibacteria bacterium]|nr:putative integral rane protein [Candidatus Saccharibacteria bacterium]MDB5180284.1 putative integral rane protein [Candidatus Saccharibacteria bacterium]